MVRRLTAALATLYDNAVPRHDTGRSRSTAEAERNTPPTGLSRVDLGWRSLLFALPTLPPLARASQPSALLAGQGLAQTGEPRAVQSLERFAAHECHGLTGPAFVDE